MSFGMALLIDYEYCAGCSDCEIACMNTEGHSPDHCGIRVMKLGPWIGPNGKYQYDYLPVPTDWCDLCQASDELKKSKPPFVRHCASGAIKIGTLSDMTELAELKKKLMIFTL